MRATTVNLCFHGVGTPRRELEAGEAGYWISAAGYADILDEVAADPRVRLSFDDGNSSDAELGLPGLVQRGLTATFFVLAGRLDRPGSLARSQVRELADAGMTIGSHGMDHRPWRGLAEDDVRREIGTARTVLEDLVQAPVDQAALPLGRYDRRVLAVLRRHGYRFVHTSDRRWAREGAWLQPRFSIRHDDTPAIVVRSVLSSPSAYRRTRNGLACLVKRLR